DGHVTGVQTCALPICSVPRPSNIAAGTYRSLDKDYFTIGMFNFAVVRADLPNDLVYQLVKAVFENQPRLVKATSTANETIPQNRSEERRGGKEDIGQE